MARDRQMYTPHIHHKENGGGGGGGGIKIKNKRVYSHILADKPSGRKKKRSSQINRCIHDKKKKYNLFFKSHKALFFFFFLFL